MLSRTVTLYCFLVFGPRLSFQGVFGFSAGWLFWAVFGFGAGWLAMVVSGFRSAMVVLNRFLFRCGVAVLGCLWFSVRVCRFNAFLVSMRGGCFGLCMVFGPRWSFQNVFGFGAVWLSWVVSVLRSAVVVSNRFLFRRGVAVLGCLYTKTYTDTHTCKHIHTHIHILINTHTQIHINIHIHILHMWG